MNLQDNQDNNAVPESKIKEGYSYQSADSGYGSGAESFEEAITGGGWNGKGDFYVYRDGTPLVRMTREYPGGANSDFNVEPLADGVDTLLEGLPGGKLEFIGKLADEIAEKEELRRER